MKMCEGVEPQLLTTHTADTVQKLIVRHLKYSYCFIVYVPGGFGGLVISMLASGTPDRGFKPGRSIPSFGGEVKPSVPCRRFAACKRSLNGVEKA
jgi:hypothetical protein